MPRSVDSRLLSGKVRAMGSHNGRWSAYNDAQVGRGLRPLCSGVLAHAGGGEGRLAVDLGAGAGIESKALLDAGWRVVAIDSDDTMPDRLDRLTGGSPDLEVRVAAFEDAEFPDADLIHAGYALPFVHPRSFPDVWQRIRQALRPGAWLAVDLFGERDSWATEDGMTFLSRTRVEEMLAGLQVFALEEEERDGPAFGGPKHWHVFHAIGRQS